jgi:YgiT-type zinc finger domain-containing protein
MTSITLTRDGSTIVVEKVPADVCANCGEGHLDQETAERHWFEI